MVVPKQIEALIDYLESHRELALGHYSRSKEGREQARKQWNELALILNNKGQNPAIKSGDEWRLYYNEYKYKCLKKIKYLRTEHNKASKNIMLTPSQERLHRILGVDVMEPLLSDVKEPLHGAKIDPLFQEEALPDDSQWDDDTIDISTPPLGSPTSRSPPPESDQERLVRVKHMKAEAIMAQARATNRLAAAIERGIERLSQVIVLQSSKKKRKRRRSETSDSE